MKMMKKICVIGLGRFGYQLSTSLAVHGMEVLSIDSNESIIASIRDKVTQAVCMRVTDEETLKSVGIEDMDIVVVAMGEDFAQSILITAILKKRLNIPQVIARAVSKIHEDILMLVGANKIVFPERDLGIRLANNLSFSLAEFIHITDKFAVTEVHVPKSFIGKTISELQLKKSRHVTCIGVKKDNEITIISPDYVIIEDDCLVVAGKNVDLVEIVEETNPNK